MSRESFPMPDPRNMKQEAFRGEYEKQGSGERQKNAAQERLRDMREEIKTLNLEKPGDLERAGNIIKALQSIEENILN